MIGRSSRNYSRKIKNSARTARKIIGGGARKVNTLLNTADKMSGGMITQYTAGNPYAKAAQVGLRMAAYRPSQNRD